MLQNFLQSPWQSREKQCYHIASSENPPTWFDAASRNNTNNNIVYQTPFRSPRLCSLNPTTILSDYNNQRSLSLSRQSSDLSITASNLTTPTNHNLNNTQSNSEKCTDRFIPKIKMSSNYYSLLLTEQKYQQASQKREKSQGSSQCRNMNDRSNYSQSSQISNIQQSQNQQQSQQQSQSGYDDGGNNRQNNHQSSSRNNTNNNSSDDTYTELLRNNIIIREISDYQNRQNNSAISLFPHTKKHPSSTSFNHKINGGACHDTGILKKSPKVLSYKMTMHRQKELIEHSDDIVFNSEPQENRKISSKPYKILDAPSLSGDFYTNILEWTRQNLVVVALNNSVYTWSPVRHDVTNLMENSQSSSSSSSIPDLPQANIISLSSNRDGQMLAVGDELGYVKLFDIEKTKLLYEYQAHSDRVGAIAWNNNLLTTASKDYSIKIRDIRMKTNVNVLNFHKEQVCGIKWSEDGVNLASGGNDNKVCVYNMKMNKLTSVFQSHNGAVKALAWSPHKHNVLVSGGGNKDQTLKFWNTQTNSLIKSIHTGSQVCNMVFSKNHNEIVTTHGFQLNQVSVWSADNYSQIITLYGHTERVLYLALSPDQEDIVTGSADETLRFWKVFNQNKKREQSSGVSKLDPVFSSLR